MQYNSLPVSGNNNLTGLPFYLFSSETLYSVPCHIPFKDIPGCQHFFYSIFKFDIGKLSGVHCFPGLSLKTGAH
jgi:hypothetical protein